MQVAFRNSALLCRFKIRKATDQLGLKLARDMKSCKKGACKYIGSDRTMWAHCSKGKGM